MDPICHTLVGATVAETGLKHRTRFATAAAIIGANLPDVDVVASFLGPTTSFAWRRGWTHGLPALVVLPLCLTAGLLLWGRLRPAHRDPPVRPLTLWTVATIATVTHPLLDYLNTYGMRWLMPFVDRWFYGDTLFIVDPWMWAILAGGIVLSRRRAKRVANAVEPPSLGVSTGRPARIALIVAAVYVAVMGLGTAVARHTVSTTSTGGEPVPSDLMAGPVPVNPFVRAVVLRDDGVLRLGRVRLLPRPHAEIWPAEIPINRTDPRLDTALNGREASEFLHWARFPFFEIRETPDSTIVDIIDARYALESDAPFGVLRVARPKRDVESGPGG